MSLTTLNFIESLLGYCIGMPILILSVMYIVESYVDSFYDKGER